MGRGAWQSVESMGLQRGRHDSAHTHTEEVKEGFLEEMTSELKYE